MDISNTPILRHKDFKHLVRELELGPHEKVIRDARGMKMMRPDVGGVVSYLDIVLPFVTAVAYGVATKSPGLLERKTISLAVEADNWSASASYGAWYQLLPAMWGIDASIDVTLIGNADTDVFSGQIPAIPELERNYRRAERFNGDFPSYVSSGVAPDIVCLHCPRISTGGHLVYSSSVDGIPELLERGTFVMGTDYEWLARDATLKFFQAYSVGRCEPFDNPFAGPPMPVEDGGVMWSAQSSWVVRLDEHRSMDVDQSLVATVLDFIRQAEDFNNKGTGNPGAGLWHRVGDNPHAVLGALGGVGVHVKTHELYRMEYRSTGKVSLYPTGVIKEDFLVEPPTPADSLSRLDLALAAGALLAEPLIPKEFAQSMKDPQAVAEMANSFAAFAPESEREGVTDLLKQIFGQSGVDAGDPLFMAVTKNEDHDIAILVLDEGHDPNKRDGEGWTPLHEAARVNAAACAEVLVEMGADVNAMTPLGWAPLDIAITRNHTKTALLLLEKGADPNHSIMGRPSTIWAAAKMGNLPASIAAWLASNGFHQP